MVDLYEGSVCIVYHPAGYTSIIVSFLNSFINPHTVVVQNRSALFFPVDLNVRSLLQPLLKMTLLSHQCLLS